jgi:hypothetical protein
MRYYIIMDIFIYLKKRNNVNNKNIIFLHQIFCIKIDKLFDTEPKTGFFQSWSHDCGTIRPACGP